MRDVHKATNGQEGDANGYSEYGFNRIPDNEPCDECKAVLNGDGVIMIAKDTQEFLRLDKEQVDSLVGRVGDGEKCIDFDAIRGKACTIEKAWWYTDKCGNIRLRNPKE
jgi:hypothetical protein